MSEAATVAEVTAENGTGRRPNLVMIVMDQLRFDCLGSTTDGRVATPNMDRLGAAGTVFTSAYSHLPTCCPARQSLVSGQRPETLGALWNFDIALPIPSISPSEADWPVILHRAGYRSAYVGKWHVSEHHDPTDFGYDRYVSEWEHRTYLAAEGKTETQDKPDWTGAVSELDVEDSRTHWLARQAIEQVTEFAAADDGAPWHVRLDFPEPHLPSCPVEQFAARYPADDIDPWPNFDDTFEGKPYIQRQQLLSWGVEDWPWSRWAPMVSHYLAMITQVDDAIGQVLDALDRLGVRDDTVIMLTTDHGDLGGSHKMMDKHYVLYEEVVHVPLIMAGPGIAAGATSDAFVYNLLDAAPTLADLLGLPPSPEWCGRSLGPILREGAAPEDWRNSVVLTYNGQQFGLFTQRALRTRRWKYVWNATDVDELYDLDADPHELTNVVGRDEHAATLAELRAELYAELVAAGDRQVTNDWVARQFAGAKL